MKEEIRIVRFQNQFQRYIEQSAIYRYSTVYYAISKRFRIIMVFVFFFVC